MVRAKSWNFSSARSSLLQAVFEHALEDLKRAGLATAIVRPLSGSVLLVQPTAPPDLATLPQAALTCQQFLKLKSGDLALVNDPSSGSFSLSTFTCVTAVQMPEGFELLIAARFEVPQRLSATGKPDDEGVRVPPMPIASRRSMNKDILAAMSMHPLAATGLVARIESAAELLFEAARRLEALARAPGTVLTSATLESYLEDSSHAFEASLAKLPLGTAVVSGRVLGSDEQVKLTLELSENHVQFDFKGTEASSKVGLTELTTLGTCIWSVLALLETSVPLTSTVLGHFQVSAPTNTLLSSRAQTSLERGVSLVVPLVGELVHEALAKINPTLRRASTAGTDALAQIEFSDGRTQVLSASPGTAAIATEAGQDAFGAWNPATEVSVETSEHAGFSWSANGVKAGTGGKGTRAGGNGELVAARVHEPAKVRWFLGRSSVRPEGFSGGKKGSSAELQILRAGGAAETFTSLEGVVEVSPGDEIRLFAAGGGAWGAPAPDSKETT